MSKKKKQKQGGVTIRVGAAPAHKPLANEMVHIFVDDQNLFWGITNQRYGRDFRIDFGQLLLAAAKNSEGGTRVVSSAYIAGVIPDSDSFWEVAKSKGFVVHRGYLGANNRSKQDDAFLITEMVQSLYENEGPSTMVLLAGDADYVPPLKVAVEKGWRTEIAFIDRGVSASLEPYIHEFREIIPNEIEYLQW